ncbi:MAG: HAD family hydrolase [Gammaproteobacteria bacterium]|nr:HAD family hydrolase [Gammaproteobacteria bacterium]
MKKYLIAVDLDGTLLPDLYSLSDYSIKVFQKLNELGHKIVVTTGRPPRSSLFVYKAFNLSSPIINYNGCLITNPKENNKIISSVEMDMNEIIDIYNNTKDYYHLFFCESFDDIYSNYDDENVRLLMHYNENSRLFVGDLNETLKVNVHGSLILANEGGAIKIKEYVESHFTDIATRIWEWGPYKDIVELYSLKQDKGSAIKIVRDYLGIDKKDTIACGDSQNDFEFFNEAGITVSLKNADPKIKAISTYVYDEDCADSGLAKFFNEFFDLKL